MLDHFCIAYIDDILVFSRIREEYTAHLRAVFGRLRKYSLFVKLSKCEFYASQVDFLGYRINADGISMDPSRV